MSAAERRVPAFDEQLQHGNCNGHLRDVQGGEADAVPDFHHDPFFHYQVDQVSLGCEFGAYMHSAHFSPVCNFQWKRRDRWLELGQGGSQQTELLTSISHSSVRSGKTKSISDHGGTSA